MLAGMVAFPCGCGTASTLAAGGGGDGTPSSPACDRPLGPPCKYADPTTTTMLKTTTRTVKPPTRSCAALSLTRLPSILRKSSATTSGAAALGPQLPLSYAAFAPTAV